MTRNRCFAIATGALGAAAFPAAASADNIAVCAQASNPCNASSTVSITNIQKQDDVTAFNIKPKAFNSPQQQQPQVAWVGGGGSGGGVSADRGAKQSSEMNPSASNGNIVAVNKVTSVAVGGPVVVIKPRGRRW
jgi:hypothetical protein